MIRLNYIAKLSKTMKWLKIKMPLSCQNCPVIDGRLTVECPITVTRLNGTVLGGMWSRVQSQAGASRGSIPL